MVEAYTKIIREKIARHTGVISQKEGAGDHGCVDVSRNGPLGPVPHIVPRAVISPSGASAGATAREDVGQADRATIGHVQGLGTGVDSILVNQEYRTVGAHGLRPILEGVADEALLEYAVLHRDHVVAVTLADINVVLRPVAAAVPGEDGVVDIEDHVVGVAGYHSLSRIVDIDVPQGPTRGVAV